MAGRKRIPHSQQSQCPTHTRASTPRHTIMQPWTAGEKNNPETHSPELYLLQLAIKRIRSRTLHLTLRRRGGVGGAESPQRAKAGTTSEREA